MDQPSEVYREDDDVRGVVIITPANETHAIQHDGIKITLIGIIGKITFIKRVE